MSSRSMSKTLNLLPMPIELYCVLELVESSLPTSSTSIQFLRHNVRIVFVFSSDPFRCYMIPCQHLADYDDNHSLILLLSKSSFFSYDSLDGGSSRVTGPSSLRTQCIHSNRNSHFCLYSNYSKEVLQMGLIGLSYW